MNEPEIILENTCDPLDLELAERLNEKPGDFLVMYADGKRMEGFGTPFDTSKNRADWAIRMQWLNDRSKDSWWPEFFDIWERELRKMFDLPEGVCLEDFHPHFSFRVSRVVAGYTCEFYMAVNLLEKLRKKIARYDLRMNKLGCLVEIETWKGLYCERDDKSMALALCRAVRDLLEEEPLPPETEN